MRARSLFTLIFVTAFLATSARAQESPKNTLPETIRSGVWISTDYDDLQLGYLFGRRFIIQLAPSGHLVSRIATIEPAQGGAPGAWEFRRAEDDHITAVRALDSGVLLFSMPFPLYEPPIPARAEEDNPYLMHMEHRPAPVENMNLGPDTIAAFAAFERADEICAGTHIGDSQPCRRAVFDIADADSSGALDAAELTRFWNLTAWLAEARVCNSDTPLPPDHNDADGAQFTAQALATADADKNGTLGLNEIETFLPAFAVTSYGVKWRGLLAASTLLGWAR